MGGGGRGDGCSNLCTVAYDKTEVRSGRVGLRELPSPLWTVS